MTQLKMVSPIPSSMLGLSLGSKSRTDGETSRQCRMDFFSSYQGAASFPVNGTSVA
jgi:hypothetical protein